MKCTLAVTIGVLAVVACTERRDREPATAERHSADTVVTKRGVRQRTSTDD